MAAPSTPNREPRRLSAQGDRVILVQYGGRQGYDNSAQDASALGRIRLVALCNQTWCDNGIPGGELPMSTLHVRNVPDDLYLALQQRALAQGRSLSAEVVQLLTRAVAETASSPATTLAAIRSRRAYRPRAAGAPDSTALLREDRGR